MSYPCPQYASTIRGPFRETIETENKAREHWYSHCSEIPVGNKIGPIQGRQFPYFYDKNVYVRLNRHTFMEKTFTENDVYGETRMCKYALKFIQLHSFICIKAR